MRFRLIVGYAGFCVFQRSKPGVVRLAIRDRFNWKCAFIGGTGQQNPKGIRNGEPQTGDRMPRYLDGTPATYAWGSPRSIIQS